MNILLDLDGTLTDSREGIVIGPPRSESFAEGAVRRRALSGLAAAMLWTPLCDAAATASGRNWRIAIASIECEPADSLVMLGARVGYLGPKGVVEAPITRLVDARGQAFVPKSLVWKAGPKELAPWLASGGLANVQSENVGEFQIRFDARGATGQLKLEFGDIAAFSIAKNACRSLLKPDQVQAPRKPRARAAEGKAPRIYRSTYPCRKQGTLHVTEARYPPYLPKQLLFFGRGYLPNAREVDLPMGKAPAQSYSYLGPDQLERVEAAAARAVLADFSGYVNGAHFAFNWGSQTAQSGNEAYSVGLYAIRACPK
ncbi:MAG: hypothetical protein ACT4P4_29695 [Betaproteobacteria bacterium]